MEGDSTPSDINPTQSQEYIAMDEVEKNKKKKVTTETINKDHTYTTGQSINIVNTDIVTREKQGKSRKVQIAAKNTTMSGDTNTRKRVRPDVVKSDDCIENGHDKRTENICKEETKNIDAQNINRTNTTRRNKQLEDRNLTPPTNSDASKHQEKDQNNFNATEDSKRKVDNQGISLRKTPLRQRRSLAGTQKLEPNIPQKKTCVDKCQKKTPVRGKRKSEDMEHDTVTCVTAGNQIAVNAKSRQPPKRGRQKSQITEQSKQQKLESRSKVNGKVTSTLPQQRGRKRAKKVSGIGDNDKGVNRSRAKKLKTGKQNNTQFKSSIKPFPELETDSEPIPDIADKSHENLIEALNIHLKNKPNMVIKKRSRQVPKYCDKDLCDDTTTQSSALSDSDSSSEDDDDDLPDVLSTPTSLNTACNFKPEDIVWAKMGKCPHWPAIIKSLQRKKHKASVYFIGYPQTKIRGISISVKKLQYFNCPDRPTYIEYGSKLQAPVSNLFMECVQKVDDYFRKRGLGTVTVTSPFEYFKEDESGDFSALVGLPFFTDTLDASDNEDNNVDNSKQQVENVRQSRVTKKMKEPKIVRRGTSCQRKMQKLLDFITKKNIVKDKLVGIANGSVDNERHNIYMHGPNSKRKMLKHTGFGPIVDENQQEDLYRFLQSVYNEHVLEKTGGLTGVTYITEVWIPEAILMAIENERRVNRKKAVEIFFQEGDYHQSHNVTDLFDIPSIQCSPQQQVESPQ